MRDGKIVALNTPQGLKTSTFPMPMFEFDPKQKLSFQELLILEKEEVFSFFEPYGLRFHASISSLELWNRDRLKFEAQFKIRPIEPSLEDVFIRTVEAKRT